jgi:SAM-dependent methyltransferase
MRQVSADHYNRIRKRFLAAIDRKEPVYSRLLKQFPKQSTLLDFNCGPGWFLHHVEGHFTTVGVDFSKEALTLAKEQAPKTHLILGDETVLRNIKAESIDVITVFDVLEHVPDPQPLLLELKRILTRTGLLVISVPNGGSLLHHRLGRRWWGYADSSHLWLETQQQWRIRLYEAGFTFRTRYSSGLINTPEPAFQLKGIWLWWHYLTQGLALSGIPLPDRFNDVLLLTFKKIE